MLKLSDTIVIADHYRHEFYETLPPFEVAKKKLHHRYDMIARLGGVLCAHDMQDVLGVCLLHKHFELEPEEQLVKRALVDENEALIAAQPIIDGAKAYFWRVYEHQSKLAYVPTEVFSPDEPLAQELPTFAQLVKKHPDFFIDFAKVSIELQTNNLFGLAILHPDFVRLEEGQTRLETTNSKARLLRVKAELLATLDLFEITETLWTFKPSERPNLGSVAAPKPPEPPKEPEPPQPSDDKCKTHCSGHCNGHCRYHCTTHCRSHCESNHR